MSLRTSVSIGALAVLTLLPGTAHAQWTVTALNPVGAADSRALAASSSLQGGTALVESAFHASLWSGSAASWVDLNPAGATGSIITAMSGSQQVGRATVGNVNRASLWNGTAASWVDLSPAGAMDSAANATSGTQQVGSVFIDGLNRASVWSGTAASWVDLHPTGPRPMMTPRRGEWWGGWEERAAGRSGR